MSVDFSPAEFASAYQRFMEFIASQAPPHKEQGPLISDRLKEFLETDARSLSIIKESFAPHDLPNLQIAFDRFLSHPERSAEQIGVMMQHFNPGSGLSILLSSGPWPAVPIGPVQFRSIELAGGQRLRAMETGLYLIQDRGAKLVAFLASAEHFGRGLTLEIASVGPGDAENLLADIRGLVNEHSVYRGQILSLDGPTGIRFHSLPSIERESIILPSRLLDRIDRDTLGFTANAPRLQAARRHLKRGLLFYGPPGTGKTLTIMYLAARMHGRTVILLTGRVLGLVSQACNLARQLAPSTVVLEDVDLIAQERGPAGGHGPVLFELLNEMDGLAEDTDVLFLLSTNRPDLIEPALAARPGRIDQAVEFPIPDEDSRRRLFALYGKGLDLRAKDLEDMIRRSEGVSPAFIRELLRKSALIAAEQSPGEFGPPIVADTHLREAFRAILVEGGEMTRSLLGVKPGAVTEWPTN